MSYEDNPYYHPEKHGLDIVGEIEWNDDSYQFDLTVVWRRTSDGQLFYADDTGCSCPTPFEDHNSAETLTACSVEGLRSHLHGVIGGRHRVGAAARAKAAAILAQVEDLPGQHQLLEAA